MNRDIDDDVLVNIDDIADLVGKEPAAPAKETEAKAEPKPDRATALLTRERDTTAAELAEERKKRAEAEEAAREAADRAAQWGAHANNSDYHTIVASLTGAQAILDSAKREYALALKEGDVDKAAEAQERISTAAIDVRDLKSGKAEMEAKLAQARQQKALAEPEADKRVTDKRAYADPVDAYEAQLAENNYRLGVLTKDFLKQNPEFVTDKALNAKLVAWSQVASAEGIKPHSAEFISFLEEKLGIADGGGEAEEDVEVEPAKAEPRKAKTVAAPVSRAPAKAAAPSQVRLSAAERDAAQSIWPELEPRAAWTEYAKGKLRAEADGLYR